MEKNIREINVCGISNLDTHISITVSGEVQDLRELIFKALKKLDQFNSPLETFKVVNIDSIRRLKDNNI